MFLVTRRYRWQKEKCIKLCVSFVLCCKTLLCCHGPTTGWSSRTTYWLRAVIFTAPTLSTIFKVILFQLFVCRVLSHVAYLCMLVVTIEEFFFFYWVNEDYIGILHNLHLCICAPLKCILLTLYWVSGTPTFLRVNAFKCTGRPQHSFCILYVRDVLSFIRKACFLVS